MEQEHHEHKGSRHGRGHRGRGGMHSHGPKTFRRGRAITFLEMMHTKRVTIKEQLEKDEFESISQVLIGELKAIDMIINEFVQLFDIQKEEMTESGKPDETMEGTHEEN